MLGSGQVFTCQVGPLSNRIGSEYWNSFTDRNDPSFFTASGCPIVLCVDAKGGSTEGMLLRGREKVQLQPEDIMWQGKTLLVDRRHQHQEDVARSGGGGGVHYDVHSVSVLSHVVSQVTPFFFYQDGAMLEESRECLWEDMRHWSESLDTMRSFRLLWDANSGFSRVAEVCAQYALDEHSKCSLLCWPTWETPYDHALNNPPLMPSHTASSLFAPASHSISDGPLNAAFSLSFCYSLQAALCCPLVVNHHTTTSAFLRVLSSVNTTSFLQKSTNGSAIVTWGLHPNAKTSVSDILATEADMQDALLHASRCFKGHLDGFGDCHVGQSTIVSRWIQRMADSIKETCIFKLDDEAKELINSLVLHSELYGDL